MAEKTVKISDLRAMTPADLGARLDQLRQELWQHRIKVKEGSLQQAHLLRFARRQIAQLQTVLREQERAANAKR